MTRQQLRKLARLAKKEKGGPFITQGLLDFKARYLARLAKKEKGPPFEMQGKLDLKVKYKIIDKHGKDVTKERAHAFSS